MRSGLGKFQCQHGSPCLVASPASARAFQHAVQLLWKSLCGSGGTCSVRWHTHPDIALQARVRGVFAGKRKSAAPSQSPARWHGAAAGSGNSGNFMLHRMSTWPNEKTRYRSLCHVGRPRPLQGALKQGGTENFTEAGWAAAAWAKGRAERFVSADGMSGNDRMVRQEGEAEEAAIGV